MFAVFPEERQKQNSSQFAVGEPAAKSYCSALIPPLPCTHLRDLCLVSVYSA